jgi:mitochondrial fission protein ELM1
VLLFGGSDPKAALGLGLHLASLARERGGCVLASVLPSGSHAADALATGLSGCLHLIYRAGEPGEDPTLGFLGHADAVVVARVGALTLSEACAAPAPLFAALADGERRDMRRLLERMRHAGQLRLLQDDLSPWPRQPLDEAGRIAQEIRARFGNSTANPIR